MIKYYEDLTEIERHKAYEMFLQDCANDEYMDNPFEDFQDYNAEALWVNLSFDAESGVCLG